MSRILSSEDVIDILKLISEERFQTFRAMTDTDENAIKLYQETMNIGTSVMSVLGVIEVALRNTIIDQISESFEPAWLRNVEANVPLKSNEKSLIKSAEQRAKRAAYGKLNSLDKRNLDAEAFPYGQSENITHQDIAKARQQVINVTDGQVVSQLTLFFWKSLFSERYEDTLWRRSLKRVFPNKTYSRAFIADHLETLYHIRNRLAHHEPVYGKRFDGILVSIDFIMMNLKSQRPSNDTPVAKFISPYKERLDADVECFKSEFNQLTN